MPTADHRKLETVLDHARSQAALFGHEDFTPWKSGELGRLIACQCLSCDRHVVVNRKTGKLSGNAVDKRCNDT